VRHLSNRFRRFGDVEPKSLQAAFARGGLRRAFWAETEAAINTTQESTTTRRTDNT
jgi:hypothetical protein